MHQVDFPWLGYLSLGLGFGILQESRQHREGMRIPDGTPCWSIYLQ
jgi:hypothetical protein